MDERATTDDDNAVSEVEVVDVDQTPEGDDEVEGHSMAISANFPIEIGATAVPGTQKPRENGTPTPPPIR